MISKEILTSLLQKPESPILEFKREWYWTSDLDGSDLSPKWGEFYKDLISLSNGYLDFVGQDRYLIIGFCEKEQKIYNVDTSSIKALQNIRIFRIKLIERLEQLTSPSLLNLEVEFIEQDGNSILIIKIPSPKRLTELKAELSTKTRTLDPGAILVRKGQDGESIRQATLSEVTQLSQEFDKFKNLALPQDQILLEQKKRSIANTVQLYIEKNSSFSIDVDFPKVHRDWSENIIFELFKISEALGGSKYFLYVHEKSSQGKTYGFLKKNDFLAPGIPLIVLTERPSIKDQEKRKENIASAFKTPLVYFIDEFGLNHLYGDFIQNYESYNLPIFVESLTNEYIDGDNSALRILNNWYQSVAAPLMVIKGYGGIGKTTLVKQFLDNVSKSDNNVGLLFIDSNDIIDRLSKAARADKKIDDLYDFYLAQYQSEDIDAKNFSKDLLKLSVDNGSLVIVLDGIDEVIAKLGSKFDIACFINSILTNYSNNLERGKILITCRDNFWRELADKTNIQDITLTPFNGELAHEFFNQSFDENSTKITRAMDMANKFALKKMGTENEASIYIPYVLDMIAYLINHKSEFGNVDVTLNEPTKILNPKNITNDFLIGSVCEREIKKLGNYGVDEQINFMIDFSISPSGYVSLYDVKGLFETSNSLQVSDEFVEKLSGHPLLSCSEKRLYFRYDFFYQYFKTLYIFRYFSEANIEKLTPHVIDILGTYVGFDNEFSRSLCTRLSLSDDLKMFALDTIDIVRKKMVSANQQELNRLRSAISGTFALLLSMQRQETPSLDIRKCTELLKDVFNTKQGLEGICLVGISGSDRAKPVFDFRSLSIKNSHFEQYEYFWDCPTDENTRFISSTFLALEPRNGLKPSIAPNLFNENCDVEDIIDIINHRVKEIAGETDALISSLHQFFKIFYKQGNFYPKKQEDVRARLYTGKLLPTLLKNKVVADYHDPKKGTLKQYKIGEEFRPIVKLFEQGGACLEFERVVNMFTK